MSQQRSNKKILTKADKRDLMWNIVEPGDPYDIRKSMIAKLPGDRRHMGPHLELVCLLQAAEIQRLCLFLEEYQVKLRQWERIELDRHSYEIQIKQLTQRLSDSLSYKTENEKLKDFLRKQTIELQQLQKRQISSDIVKKYENSLRQIQSLLQEKQELKQSSRKLFIEAKNLKQQLKANQQIKTKQYETLSRQLDRMHELQAVQEQNYRDNLSRSQLDRKKSEKELDLLSKKYQEQTQHIKQLQNINKGLKNDLQRLKYQLSRASQLSLTIKQYQNRFKLLAEEIQRLNGVLREKSKQLNDSYARSSELTQTIRQNQSNILQLEKKVKNLEQSNSILQRQQRQTLLSLSNLEQNKQIIQSYEASLQKFSIQVERLNSILRKKIVETQQCKKKQSEAEAHARNFNALQKQCKDLKAKFSQVSSRLLTFQREKSELELQNRKLNDKLQVLLESNAPQSKNFIDSEQKIGDIENIISPTDDVKKLRSSKKVTQVERIRNALAQSEEKSCPSDQIFSYLRQIKSLQQDLKEKQQDVQFYRKKAAEAASFPVQSGIENDNQLSLEELLSKVKSLQLSNYQIQSQNKRLKRAQPILQKGQQSQRQILLQQYRQIQRLKDLLLNKDIQISRLSEINDHLQQRLLQLREKQQSIYKSPVSGKQLKKENKFVDQIISKGSSTAKQNFVDDSYRRNNPDLSSDRELPNRQNYPSYYQPHWKITNSSNYKQKISEQQRNFQIQAESNDPYYKPLQKSSSVLLKDYNLLLRQHEILTDQNQKTKIKLYNLQQQRQKLIMELQLKLSDAQALNKQLKVHIQPSVYEKIQQDHHLKRQYSELLEKYNNLIYDNQLLHRQISSTEAKPRLILSDSSHQLQIKHLINQNEELRTKCNQLNQCYSKIILVNQQLGRLNNILEGKQREIQIKDSLISKLEGQKGQMIAKINKRQQEIQDLNGQISQNPDKINSQILKLRKTNTQFQQKIKMHESNQINMKQKYQNRLQVLDQQIARLNNLLASRKKDILILEDQNKAFQRQIEQPKKIDKQQNSYQRITLYQNKIVLLSQQIERLNGLLMHRRDISRPYQIRIDEQQEYSSNNPQSNIQNSFDPKIIQTREIYSDKYKIIQNTGNLHEYQIKMKELSAQIDRLNRILLNEKNDYELKQARYLTEIERLNNSLRLKVQQSIFFEQRERILGEGSLSNIRQKAEKDYSDNRQSFRQTPTFYKNQQTQYQKRIQQFVKQFDRLHSVIKSLQYEKQIRETNSVDDLIEKNRYLSQQIDTLNAQFERQTQELLQLRLKIANQSSLQQRLNEDLGLFVILFAEIESLRSQAEEGFLGREKTRKAEIAARKV